MPKPSGTAIRRRLSSARPATRGGAGCHAAAAIRNRPAHQPVSTQPPETNVPSAVPTRYSESASQNVLTPIASRIQVRSRRQPVPASAPTISPSRTQVADRIGEVGGDLERLALDVVEHGLEHERRAQRRDGERGDDAVDPQRPRTARARARSSSRMPGERERRQQQEADVGRRGDRDVLRGPQDGGVVDLAERPGEHAAADQQPGQRARGRRGGRGRGTAPRPAAARGRARSAR